MDNIAIFIVVGIVLLFLLSISIYLIFYFISNFVKNSSKLLSENSGANNSSKPRDDFHFDEFVKRRGRIIHANQVVLHDAIERKLDEALKLDASMLIDEAVNRPKKSKKIKSLYAVFKSIDMYSLDFLFDECYLYPRNSGRGIFLNESDFSQALAHFKSYIKCRVVHLRDKSDKKIANALPPVMFIWRTFHEKHKDKYHEFCNLTIGNYLPFDELLIDELNINEVNLRSTRETLLLALKQVAAIEHPKTPQSAARKPLRGMAMSQMASSSQSQASLNSYDILSNYNVFQNIILYNMLLDNDNNPDRVPKDAYFSTLNNTQNNVEPTSDHQNNKSLHHNGFSGDIHHHNIHDSSFDKTPSVDTSTSSNFTSLDSSSSSSSYSSDSGSSSSSDSGSCSSGD